MIAQQLSIFDLTITSPSVPQNESNNETRNEEWGNPDFLLQRLVYPNQKRAARLRELADNMQATIDYKKNSAITTQRPTARRLEIAHSMAEEGERLEKVQCWLYGLADAAESGDEPAVTQGITNRRQLEIFSFFDCENWSDQNIEKVFTSNNEKEWLKSLTSAKIHSLSQAKTTLAALNSLSNFKPADDPTELKIAKKERELVGSKIPGYFPTPSEVCDHMVQLAKIQPGQIALEPSAGKGCISEALRRVGAIAHCIEPENSLREILILKGFELVGADIMDYDEREYSAIVMNPPFNAQIEHIKKCFTLLVQGGRLVAIASESIQFRTERKYKEFRDWLDNYCVLNEALPDGTFLHCDNPTNIKTRLLVLQK